MWQERICVSPWGPWGCVLSDPGELERQANVRLDSRKSRAGVGTYSEAKAWTATILEEGECFQPATTVPVTSPCKWTRQGIARGMEQEREKGGYTDARQNMDPSTGMDITLEPHLSPSWQTRGSIEALHLWSWFRDGWSQSLWLYTDESSPDSNASRWDSKASSKDLYSSLSSRQAG